MQESATWVTWVWVGGFLLGFVLALRVVWHNFIIQSLWMVLLYNLGVDPSKIHPHRSKRQKRRDAKRFAHERAVRTRREHQALTDFFPQVQTFLAAPESERKNIGPGEWVISTVSNTGLVEDRSTGGGWMGNSRSVGFPIGHHHHLSYEVGRTYGGYVKAPPAPVVVDIGVTTLTNQRLIFRGQSQTRECRFDKLLGYDFFDDDSGISIAVSNQQSTLRIKYGEELGPWFSIRWRFMLALRNGTTSAFLEDAKVRKEALQSL
jgi:hypothetical protein